MNQEQLNDNNDEILLLMLKKDNKLIDFNMKQLKIYNEYVRNTIDEMSVEIKKWIDDTIKYNAYLLEKQETLLKSKEQYKQIKKYERHVNQIQHKIEETNKILVVRPTVLTFLSKNKNKMLLFDNDFFELKKMLKNAKPVDILRKQLDMDKQMHELFMCNYNLHKDIHQL
jgi:hypothetical protein